MVAWPAVPRRPRGDVKFRPAQRGVKRHAAGRDEKIRGVRRAVHRERGKVRGRAGERGGASRSAGRGNADGVRGDDAVAIGRVRREARVGETRGGGGRDV